MSYADRLNSFNQAITTAKEHAKSMKETLSNPELRENPVRFGLDAAGQVLGTGEGLVRIRNAMTEGDVRREEANAFFNRLGELNKGNQSLANSIGSNVREALQNVSGRARQTVASATADAQPTRLVQSSQTIQEGRAIPKKATDPSRADLEAEDGGISDRIGGFPQSIIRASDEANEINNSINAKIRGGLTGNERAELNDVANESLGDFNTINRIPVGQGKADALKNYLTAKNNIANDVLARKTQGLNPAKGYDTTGNPLGEDSTILGKALKPGGITAKADSDGTANAGANAGKTLGKAPATNNATSGLNTSAGGDASNQGLSAARRVGTQIDDIQDAGTAARATVDDGANIVNRGRALNLIQTLVPGQGGGQVQGLSTIGNASGDANTVSLAQHVNSAQAQLAQSVGNQVSSGGEGGVRATQLGITGSQADADATSTGGRSISQSLASSAGRNADEEGSNAGRGIAKALAGEETLDALAPDTGPLGPLLEAGSLLATLGTEVASIFEPEAKESKPEAPPPQAQSGFSIGANLKGDAGGAVGAF